MNFKHAFFVTLWAALAILSLLLAYQVGHNDVDRDVQTKLDELYAAFECKNNACDRFKGADAIELEARLMAEIDKRCKH